MTAPTREQVAQAIHDADCGCDAKVTEYQTDTLDVVMPLIRAGQATALREAADDYDEMDWQAAEFLRARADRLEDK